MPCCKKKFKRIVNQAKCCYSLANCKRLASIQSLPLPPAIEFIYFFELTDFHKARTVCSGHRESRANARRTFGQYLREVRRAHNAMIKCETYFAHRRTMFDRVVTNIVRLRSSRRRRQRNGFTDERFNMPSD